MFPLSYGQGFFHDPCINQEPIGDQTCGQAPGATVANDQGWTALGRGDEAPPPYHFDNYTPPVSTASPPCDQFVSQPYSLPYETQPHGTGEHVIIKGVRDRGKRKRTSTRPKVKPRKPWCADCNKDFARTQEFKRHLTEVHGPSRQCPLCDFKWIRPDKIKAHIIANHQDKLSSETLDHINSLCGREIVAFVDGIAGPYGSDLDTNPATFHPPISQGSSLFDAMVGVPLYP